MQAPVIDPESQYFSLSIARRKPMRIGLLTAIALLITAGTASAVDPAIVFQTQPIGQVLDQFRTAADIVAGPKAVKAFNKNLKETFGEKGLLGLDINQPIVGYVLLAPRPEDIAAVIALPITGEAEFLDLCERANHRQPRLIDKTSGIYELPALEHPYSALMRFSEKHAYIAYGLKPAAALADKTLVSASKLHAPEERGIVAGRIYFDRIPLVVKLAYPVLFQEVKKTIFGTFRVFDLEGDSGLGKAIQAEMIKLITRYAKLAEGADVLAARVDLDISTANLSVEAVLTGKPRSELSTMIAARKATTNKFGGIVETPDTIFGVRARLPLFEPEIRAAAVAGLEEAQQKLAQFAGAIQGKGLLDESCAALIRTVKTGEFDVAVGIRGPDKENWYSLVVAVALENPSAVEKEFKKIIQANAPEESQKKIKWDADKAGTVGIHTFQIEDLGEATSLFGGNECALALAFAPEGVFVVMGVHPVETMKSALATKRVESPVLDVFVTPTEFGKFIVRANPNKAQNAKLAAILKEEKRTSLMSLSVTGGQELRATYTINLRLLPRIAFVDEFDDEKKPVLPPGVIGK